MKHLTDIPEANAVVKKNTFFSLRHNIEAVLQSSLNFSATSTSKVSTEPAPAQINNFGV